MRSLASSLADGVLADAILFPPCPPIPPTNISYERGLTETKTMKIVKMLGWLNASLQCMETMDKLSTTLYAHRYHPPI